MVEVLVGKRESDGSFQGYWAEFEGKRKKKYVVKDIVYTLYTCTFYNYDAYRVHTSDETDPTSPIYKLYPESESSGDFTRPFDKNGLAEAFPIFLKDIEYFSTYPVDPPSSQP